MGYEARREVGRDERDGERRRKTAGRWQEATPRPFTNHGDTENTEGTIFFARSGDGDRAKDRSPAGTI